MQIVRLRIERFRCIGEATLYPTRHNVFLGPNNIGKTALLEALNLLLNPEGSSRADVIDENDFYRREYRSLRTTIQIEPSGEGSVPPPPADASINPTSEDTEPPRVIRIEAVLTGLEKGDLSEFSSVLVPWDPERNEVVEVTDEGVDPFASAERAIRPCFEAWYDEEEDEFTSRSFFQTDPDLARDDCPSFSKQQKRRIGFLIYRDFRALQRPVTLESAHLFSRLLASQEATPRHFEAVLERLEGGVLPLFSEPNFARAIQEYRSELSRYLPLAHDGDGELSFEATDRTRDEVKAAAQLYVRDALPLPLQKMGAGTRSLAILAMLLLIARKRGRGIIALEEPETFLFPHAQRRVIDEVLGLASQTFTTTHSPYILERVPIEGFQRVQRCPAGILRADPVVTSPKDGRQVKDRLKRQLSEALLGRAAVIVEEDSIRLWILRASALLHGEAYEGLVREALELHGIAVVSTRANGEVPAVAELLSRAGLNVIGVLDRLTDQEADQLLEKNDGLTLVFLPDKGLETLLARTLPAPILRAALTNAPGAKHTYDPVAVTGWTEDDLRKHALEFLKQHKGHLTIHEWLLDQLDLTTLPEVFKRLVLLASALSAGPPAFGSCSVLCPSR